MKSVLISIQPKWCELIASGKKTVEVRKTRPKLETPFKVYIYCSKGFKPNTSYSYKTWAGYGKVIGEFVCDRIDYWQHHWTPDVMHIEKMSELSCVSTTELLDYLGGIYDNKGNNKRLYAWHISDLVIYDKPKELGEFHPPCNHADYCTECKNYDFNTKDCRQIIRPPQSWCYVEAL